MWTGRLASGRELGAKGSSGPADLEPQLHSSPVDRKQDDGWGR